MQANVLQFIDRDKRKLLRRPQADETEGGAGGSVFWRLEVDGVAAGMGVFHGEADLALGGDVEGVGVQADAVLDGGGEGLGAVVAEQEQVIPAALGLVPLDGLGGEIIGVHPLPKKGSEGRWGRFQLELFFWNIAFCKDDECNTKHHDTHAADDPRQLFAGEGRGNGYAVGQRIRHVFRRAEGGGQVLVGWVWKLFQQGGQAAVELCQEQIPGRMAFGKVDKKLSAVLPQGRLFHVDSSPDKMAWMPWKKVS